MICEVTIKPCTDPSDAEGIQEPWDATKVAAYVNPRSVSQQACDLLIGALLSLWGGMGHHMRSWRALACYHRIVRAARRAFTRLRATGQDRFGDCQTQVMHAKSNDNAAPEMKPPRVLLFTNIVSPYRLPVFEKIAEVVDLEVLFAQEKTADRLWQPNLGKYIFRHRILSRLTLKLGGATQIINLGLLRHIWQSGFDVAIVGDNRQNMLSTFAICLVAWFRRRPMIVWTAATPGEALVARSKPMLRRLFRAFRHSLFRHSEAIVAYGTATVRYLDILGVNSDNVFAGTQIMPASELPVPSTDRNALGLQGKRMILSVNYMVSRKGLVVLIDAFRRIAGADDILVLVGSGPEEARLRELARGDERIWFPGYQESAEKTCWYAAADLFVFPTLHDPWGLVVNEAMAFGLPIITTDAAGCAPDLLQDNGVIVPAGDVDALAAALGHLLADEALRHRMGQRSREIIADYTVKKACDTFVQAIEYVLEK